MKESYLSLVDGKIPPWVMRFIKGVGRTINRYSMIHAGDRVLLASSGGKDSLALALALSLRRKWMPVDYSIESVLIDWTEHPIPPEGKEKLEEYFASLSIPFSIISEPQQSPGFNGSFDCYLCSRNRRRILFQEAEKRGISIIAMGHHLDDLAETTIMNLCFRARFQTMKPVQDFFDGKISLIRPMIETRENAPKRLSEAYDIPTVKPVCPYDQTNIRSRLKPIVRELCHIDPLAREHILKAHGFKTDDARNDL